jgi:predicted DCC family thiol-disulfide oxidoreductase YuxK
MTTTAEARPSEKRLPTPAERPGADIVIYDGNCRMCSAQVRKLAWWDCQNRLAYLSLHDPEVALRFPDLSHDALMKEIYVVDCRGIRHRGAEAFRYLSRRLRRLWWLAPLLHIPGSLPLWQWLYQQVARRRYLFGRTDGCDNESCEIHRK